MSRGPSGVLLAVALVIALVLILPAVYWGMCAGLPDALLITPHRARWLAALEASEQARPPDISTLCLALKGPDHAVAASAASSLERLAEDGVLSSAQTDRAAHTLLEVLGKPSHWWRFGWDREEAEFAQFTGAATSAAAALGARAVPQLARALDSPLADQREAACWVACLMVRRGTVRRAALIAALGRDRIVRLRSHDASEGVRAACGCAALASE